MTDLSLLLTNDNISLRQNMEAEVCTAGSTEFETVEIAECKSRKVKVPRRIIHFANGETMEEYSTDEEEEEEEHVKQVVSVDTSKLTWGPYFWFHMWRVATSTISVCDYMGEKLASLFGITSPKYQYAIDEYYRMKKEEEEEEEENRLADEAERTFAAQRRGEQENSTTVKEQPEGNGATFVNVSFELEPESSLRNPDPNRVPSPLPS
ncbi:protein FAM177A1 [Poecilia formosa]|uniref:Family with sequence similarity 177 member A1 n=1 Tax=Poecilia formosa TaxID=48698 RepID=A0A087Y6I9_POEFO|nr:PREDICTED: protein FAM177A1 [Poecilia formosa]